MVATTDMLLNTVLLLGLPGGGDSTQDPFALLGVLGGAGSTRQMVFQFSPGWCGASLAFTDPCLGWGHLLLVAEPGRSLVHVIDVVSRTHVGYVVTLESKTAPWGIATRGSLVAVSCWTYREYPRNHSVRLYEGGGPSWTRVRTIGCGPVDPQVRDPRGVRFTVDGSAVVVANGSGRGGRVLVYEVIDGGFREVLSKCAGKVYDVEPHDDGWFVMSRDMDGTWQLSHIDAFGARRHVNWPGGSSLWASIACVPGLGLLVRTDDTLQVLADPLTAATYTMSTARVSWMTVCCRAIRHKETKVE
jgi:hypothetical protein